MVVLLKSDFVLLLKVPENKGKTQKTVGKRVLKLLKGPTIVNTYGTLRPWPSGTSLV